MQQVRLSYTNFVRRHFYAVRPDRGAPLPSSWAVFFSNPLSEASPVPAQVLVRSTAFVILLQMLPMAKGARHSAVDQ
jgi:hypothetical protein